MVNVYSLFVHLDHQVGNELHAKHSSNNVTTSDGIEQSNVTQEYIDRMDEWNDIRMKIAIFLQKALPEKCQEHLDLILTTGDQEPIV